MNKREIVLANYFQFKWRTFAIVEKFKLLKSLGMFLPRNNSVVLPVLRRSGAMAFEAWLSLLLASLCSA